MGENQKLVAFSNDGNMMSGWREGDSLGTSIGRDLYGLSIEVGVRSSVMEMVVGRKHDGEEVNPDKSGSNFIYTELDRFITQHCEDPQ